MTPTERKADQLIEEFGEEMALAQTRYHVGRTTGSLRRWWQLVGECITGPPQPERAAA